MLPGADSPCLQARVAGMMASSETVGTMKVSVDCMLSDRIPTFTASGTRVCFGVDDGEVDGFSEPWQSSLSLAW